MPLERALLGVCSSDPCRRVPLHVGGCAGPSLCLFSFPFTTFSVRAIRSRLGAGIVSTTLMRSPQLVAARCFCGPLDCSPAALGSLSSSCPSHSALASEMTLQTRTKDMQNTMATSPAKSRVMLSATLAHIVGAGARASPKSRLFSCMKTNLIVGKTLGVTSGRVRRKYETRANEQ